MWKIRFRTLRECAIRYNKNTRSELEKASNGFINSFYETELAGKTFELSAKNYALFRLGRDFAVFLENCSSGSQTIINDRKTVVDLCDISLGSLLVNVYFDEIDEIKLQANGWGYDPNDLAFKHVKHNGKDAFLMSKKCLDFMESSTLKIPLSLFYNNQGQLELYFKDLGFASEEIFFIDYSSLSKNPAGAIYGMFSESYISSHDPNAFNWDHYKNKKFTSKSRASSNDSRSGSSGSSLIIRSNIIQADPNFIATI